MTFKEMEQGSPAQLLSRHSYLGVVRAGLAVQKYTFAREAILGWLANYPGDLQAGLCYAQALVGEGRTPQALQVLQGLCMADPEFSEAAGMLFKLHLKCIDTPGDDKIIRQQATQKPNDRRRIFAPGVPVYTYQVALTGLEVEGAAVSPWANKIHLARQALANKHPDPAQSFIRQALTQQALHPLAAVTHLRYLAASGIVSQENRLKIAERYLNAWPDCLACSLYYADWLMEYGDSDKAVTLLHQAAARDVSGQVARRLWGEAHSYLPLWPERMELVFPLAIPAEVQNTLGLNRLPENVVVQERKKETPPAVMTFEQDESFEHLEQRTELPGADTAEEAHAPVGMAGKQQDTSWDELRAAAESSGALPVEVEKPATAEMPVLVEQPLLQKAQIQEAGANDKSAAQSEVQAKAGPEDLLMMKSELERLAHRLHLPGLTNQDGRYPVYIIFSVRNRLEAVYGKQISDIIVFEMEKLAQTVQKSHRWGAQVFLADDPSSHGLVDISPAPQNDAWNMKLALKDLDALLARRGEMIGALLIVGGPEIVPFHQLPNPVDDQDEDVASDNPYATLDENYFIPEWPVGRLPGGAGGDASLLLAVLRRMDAYHSRQNCKLPWYVAAPRMLFGWMRPRRHKKKHSFGYTAAVWRQASENVYRTIGEPRRINVSPPLGLSAADALALNGKGTAKRLPNPQGRLAYFNLHGLVDAPEWFGQRDPLDTSDAPDYPVALRPQDINGNGRNGRSIPRVVFSEACFGAHIHNRPVDEAISLKFLEAGSMAVAGSTCMAYGSIDTPLVAADLLGFTFWKNFQSGMPCGEALRLAKVNLVNTMHKRQGYLDGEDQKTLISFILYGDPLVASETITLQHKSLRWRTDAQPEVNIICDRAGQDGALEIPSEVMTSVKQVVSQYLPGMANARIMYTQEKSVCSGQGHACPTSQLGNPVEKAPAVAGGDGKAKSAGAPGTDAHMPVRRLVILSKQIPNTHHMHAQVARLTLDADSKVVKLVVSR